MNKEKCDICGTPLIPDIKALNFTTKEWDEHTYKFNCDCMKNKNIRISIG